MGSKLSQRNSTQYLDSEIDNLYNSAPQLIKRNGQHLQANDQKSKSTLNLKPALQSARQLASCNLSPVVRKQDQYATASLKSEISTLSTSLSVSQKNVRVLRSTVSQCSLNSVPINKNMTCESSKSTNGSYSTFKDTNSMLTSHSARQTAISQPIASETLLSSPNKFRELPTRAEGQTTPTEIMNARYLETLKSVVKSQCDLYDIEQNLNGSKSNTDEFAPDCSFNSYMTLLHKQDFLIGDYTKKTTACYTADQRENIVQLIADLNKQKQYKYETLCTAVGILDRYCSALTMSSRKAPSCAVMATIAILMAAKIEQSISPSFNRMIGLLPNHLKSSVTKKELLTLERDIIRTLQFDLQWAGPIIFAERLLKLIGLQQHVTQVISLCKLFCTFALEKSEIALMFKTSEIAAAVLTLSLNVLASEKFSKAMKSEQIQIGEKEGGALQLWTIDLELQAKVKVTRVSQIYSSLLCSVDSQILGGILSEDKKLWLEKPACATKLNKQRAAEFQLC